MALLSLCAFPWVPPEPRATRVHLGIEAVTDFPLDVGARVWLEVPHRIRFAASFGAMPEPYIDAINHILLAANAYDSGGAALLHSSLESPLVFRLHLGWQPLRRHGLYLETGYGLLVLHAQADRATLYRAALGGTVPPDGATHVQYEAQANVHMVDFEVGWQWLFKRRITARVGVGLAAAVGATARFQLSAPLVTQPIERMLVGEAHSALVNDVRRYFFTPVFTFAVGWRFR
jgi:hypothetical protein